MGDVGLPWIKIVVLNLGACSFSMMGTRSEKKQSPRLVTAKVERHTDEGDCIKVGLELYTNFYGCGGVGRGRRKEEER